MANLRVLHLPTLRAADGPPLEDAPRHMDPPILVVDDDPATCRLIQRVLTLHGYAISTVFDGEAALAAVAHRLPRASRGGSFGALSRPGGGVMNLLDQSSIRRYWLASGKVSPGIHQFEQLPPHWSPPRLRIFEHPIAARVDELVSQFLSDMSVHIIAVSPATIGPGWWPDDHSPGGEPVLHFAVSVLYQERPTPAASESVDQTPEAA